MNIDDDLKQNLKNIIDKLSTNNTHKDFLIQYSFFDYDTFDDTWVLECIIGDTINRESIYDSKLTYGAETSVTFSSYIKSYKSFVYVELINYKGSSKKGIIYACDLYEDFVPKHFIGTCTTRSSFTEWNCFRFNK